MFRYAALLLATIISLQTFSQNKDEVVATIDGEKIVKEEFVRLYKKNNQNLQNENDIKTPMEYIELFINYKLKVHEAEKLGLDTIPSFVNELKSYRNELARPYLTDVNYSEQMVKEAYQRSITDVKASHILLRLDENASPQDTAAIYKQIMEIRDRALNGEDFGELAYQYSEDPSARKNKGLLGYFTAFQMVYPFEDAAYKTPVGEISMPVRTRFGYHLIKVLDKRGSSGEMKAAHIMKMVSEQADEKYINKAKNEIDSIAGLLTSGADFSDLARTLSDDKRSASNDGEMPWFSATSMLQEFAQPAFELKKDGDISPVIRTPYGFHIIKRIAYKPVPTYDEAKDQLTEKIKKNPEISKHSKDQFIKKLKTEYRFAKNEEAIQKCFQQVTAGNDSLSPKDDITLFSFAGKEINMGAFISFLKTKNINAIKQHSSFNQFLEDFIDQTLVDYEDSQLEAKYPDFNYLMQEYHDGILLFNISEEKIWSAASNDSLGLETFYQQNNNRYTWGERFKGWVIQCPDQETKDFVDQILASDDKLSIDELTDQVKQNLGTTIKAEKGTYEKGDQPLVDYLVWNGPEPDAFVEGLQFVRGDKTEGDPKTLQEARGLYLSDYQDYLDKQWIKELRKKYKVKINKKLVKSIDPV